MNTPADTHPASIFFPAEGRAYDFFQDLGRDSALRTTILARHYTLQESASESDRHLTCACGQPGPRFYVRATNLPNNKRRYDVARFPRSASAHDSNCHFHDNEVPKHEPSDSPGPRKVLRGDFAALFVDKGHPGRVRKAVSSRRKSSAKRRRSIGAYSPSLRRFGKELLVRSGVCEWRPWYENRRSIVRVESMVAGAFDGLTRDSKSALATALLGMGDDTLFGSWSYAMNQAATHPIKKVLAHGFINTIEAPSTDESCELRFFPLGLLPLVVPVDVFASATANPLIIGPDGAFDHPLWIVCVAEQFEGVWMAHELVAFRLTRTGLIPVESGCEEQMVERLIAESRSFTRLLLPPENGYRQIPDFELEDTEVKMYIEVAGRQSPDYLKKLDRKMQRWKGRALAWHTSTPLADFTIPRPTAWSS